MRAFRSLLDDGTLDAERCVMIQVATPTREAVEHYQDERHEIERLVGEINGCTPASASRCCTTSTARCRSRTSSPSTSPAT